MVEIEIFFGFLEQGGIVIPALSALLGRLKFLNFVRNISFQDAYRGKWSITKTHKKRRVERSEHLHIHYIGELSFKVGYFLTSRLHTISLSVVVGRLV